VMTVMAPLGLHKKSDFLTQRKAEIYCREFYEVQVARGKVAKNNALDRLSGGGGRWAVHKNSHCNIGRNVGKSSYLHAVQPGTSIQCTERQPRRPKD
jgi:hypothetical protein